MKVYELWKLYEAVAWAHQRLFDASHRRFAEAEIRCQPYLFSLARSVSVADNSKTRFGDDMGKSWPRHFQPLSCSKARSHS
jgi:hypothetical protein